MSQDDWVDIESIFSKKGKKWNTDEKKRVALWLTTTQRLQYLTIGYLSLSNLDDAEDAFQDFCIKIMEEGFPEFDPQEGTAHAYILQAWRYYLTNYKRRRVRHILLERPMVVDEEDKLLVEATDRDPPVPTLVDLEQRLESLSDVQREVIVQRFFHGNGQLKPFTEIATEIGKSKEAVKKICQRAIISLRKRADNEGQKSGYGIETVPPDEEPKMKNADANNRTDRRIRQTQSEDLP